MRTVPITNPRLLGDMKSLHYFRTLYLYGCRLLKLKRRKTVHKHTIASAAGVSKQHARHKNYS
ncbi:hypothetical protein GGP41_004155 [Bipolaris sorokiniana]|uniref:Uncharacterized protein n=1 Tax=Cochliobolus sativus TaxID=45130 RepID=A0A8H5ZM15_COCSA|nr:hypothetical protein GGP41_004155 [Bipolaris sorokiniana]